MSFLATILLLLAQSPEAATAEPKTLGFHAADGLEITADLYELEPMSAKTPTIVLFHQAGWSRGEYREIAPRLCAMGFRCLAVDQRAGKESRGVRNETAARALEAEKGTSYVDAYADLVAALEYARKELGEGELIAWGSSYSASLALRLAAEKPHLVDGVLAFSPGEYFERHGKPADWIASSAKRILSPVFITSARDEGKRWKLIHDAIEAPKTAFLPETEGNHGSRALWPSFEDSGAYWEAVEAFLDEHFQRPHD